mmetsp:Transcript_5014/g.15001  ORF Transcript_5014/g.15001 Transcript_5014/m.15001 type:complete len:202 (+) Transcript_5014:1663-2268(+)
MGQANTRWKAREMLFPMISHTTGTPPSVVSQNALEDKRHLLLERGPRSPFCGAGGDGPLGNVAGNIGQRRPNKEAQRLCSMAPRSPPCDRVSLSLALALALALSKPLSASLSVSFSLSLCLKLHWESVVVVVVVFQSLQQRACDGMEWEARKRARSSAVILAMSPLTRFHPSIHPPPLTTKLLSSPKSHYCHKKKSAAKNL